MAAISVNMSWMSASVTGRGLQFSESLVEGEGDELGTGGVAVEDQLLPEDMGCRDESQGLLSKWGAVPGDAELHEQAVQWHSDSAVMHC